MVPLASLGSRRLLSPWMLLAVLLAGSLSAAYGQEWAPPITLVPPSPFTQQITVDLRSALYNPSDAAQTFHWLFSAVSPNRTDCIQQGETAVDPRSWTGVQVPWKPKGYENAHHIVFSATNGSQVYTASHSIEIVSSPIRSTQQIDGAWMGFYHWSETEGKLWNRDIRTLTEDQWKELARGMHEIGMNIIVIQETFRNQVYYNKHDIPENGYHGKAFYPSNLYPGRMDIAARDPVEAVLRQADALNMHVFMGVGLYAWFDFSADSLRWHCEAADELWQRYGHHPSFYGWYISEETPGFIHVSFNDSAQEIAQYQQEIIEFFQQFRTHVHRFAPQKPIMLATNCHFMAQAEAAWRRLVRCCDIVCPFGFHRMPEGDVTGEEAAAWLQQLCDEEGGHVWMDVEVFLFGLQGELYPRPIKGLIDDLLRFPNFEKILCYQYPGLMNAPDAGVRPGGPATVELYKQYKKFYQSKRLPSGLKRHRESKRAP